MYNIYVNVHHCRTVLNGFIEKLNTGIFKNLETFIKDK
jgi:hypothetical protein